MERDAGRRAGQSSRYDKSSHDSEALLNIIMFTLQRRDPTLQSLVPHQDQVILPFHWPITHWSILLILSSHWSILSSSHGTILSILSFHWSILSILSSYWSGPGAPGVPMPGPGGQTPHGSFVPGEWGSGTSGSGQDSRCVFFRQQLLPPPQPVQRRRWSGCSTKSSGVTKYFKLVGVNYR